MWLELAACFEVCEASGAAVVGVLNRLAASIEAEQDAVALRETALAGPRATVRLLSWLPLIGLGLGIAMGVDPIGALLGGPLGWAVLATGVTFTLAGWAWSTKMIATAAAPAAARRTRIADTTATTPHAQRRR
ncbi:type II secretion system F family protein [Arthrobacter sp. TMN-49]